MATAAVLEYIVRARDTELRGLQASIAATNAALRGSEATGFRDRLLGVSRGARDVGRGLSLGVTLPLLAIGAAAVGTTLKFDKTMNEIRQMVGVPEPALQSLRAGILSMAQALPQSPDELGASAYFILSSGIEEPADALKVLEASARAAAAGLGQTETVADAVTSVLNVYGQSADKATRATEILAGAVRLGKAEPEEFAATIGRVIPLAENLGVSFDQTAAGMAALSLAGLDASEAGTALRGVFTAVIKPSKGARDALKDAGTSVGELREQIAQKGLLPALQGLRDRFGDNQDALGALFPNIRGLNGFLALTGRRGDANAKIFDELAGNTGEVDRAFDAASKTAGFKLAAAMSSLQVALIQIGAVLVPILASVAQAGAKVADAFTKLSPNVQKAIVAFALVIAAAGPLLFIVGGLAAAVILLGTSTALIVGGLVLLAAALAAAIVGSSTFRAALAAAWAWITGTAVPAILSFGTTIRQTFDDVVAAVTPFAQTVVAWFAVIADDVRKTWPQIRAVIVTAIQVVQIIVTAALAAISSAWSIAWDTVRAVVVAVWPLIRNVVAASLQVLQNVIRLVLAVIRGDWSAAWDAIKGIVTGVLAGIRAVVVNGLQALAGVAAALAKGIGRAIWEGIKTAVTLLGSLQGLLWSKLSGVISSAASAAGGAAAAIGRAIVSGIVGGLGGLVSAVKDAVEGGLRSALSKVSPFSPIEVGAARLLGEPITRGTVAGLTGFAPAVRAALETGMRSGVGGASFATPGARGARLSPSAGAPSGGATIGKLADTIYVRDESTPEVIANRLSRRLAASGIV